MSFNFPGWHMIGQFYSDVGSFLLHHAGEALLLEIPEGLLVKDVQRALKETNTTLSYITASHDHPDHIEWAAVKRLRKAFPDVTFISPRLVPSGHQYIPLGLNGNDDPNGDTPVDGYDGLDREPLYIIKAPKHSMSDMVTIFRGVAMTGDIELGTLDSVTNEVPLAIRRDSMDRLRNFCRCKDYHVHTVFSAHLDDLRTDVNWESLFRYNESRLECAS